jgi:hypothetical protein
MTSMRALFMSLTLAILLTAGGTYLALQSCGTDGCSPVHVPTPVGRPSQEVSFADCQAQGNPVTKSSPPKCRLPNGQLVFDRSATLFESQTLGASLLHPVSWRPASDTSQTRITYEGPGGYFELRGEQRPGVTGEALAKELQASTNDRKSSIRSVQVGDRPGYLLSPSETSAEATYTLVVRLAGDTTYSHLVLQAPASHIQSLMGSLTFRKPATDVVLRGDVQDTWNGKRLSVRSADGSLTPIELTADGLAYDLDGTTTPPSDLLRGFTVEARGTLSDGVLRALSLRTMAIPVVLLTDAVPSSTRSPLTLNGHVAAEAKRLAFVLTTADDRILAEGDAPLSRGSGAHGRQAFRLSLAFDLSRDTPATLTLTPVLEEGMSTPLRLPLTLTPTRGGSR